MIGSPRQGEESGMSLWQSKAQMRPTTLRIPKLHFEHSGSRYDSIRKQNL